MTDHSVPGATAAGVTRRSRSVAFGAPGTHPTGPTATIHTLRASLIDGTAEVLA
jgi:hypothetical protein